MPDVVVSIGEACEAKIPPDFFREGTTYVPGEVEILDISDGSIAIEVQHRALIAISPLVALQRCAKLRAVVWILRIEVIRTPLLALRLCRRRDYHGDIIGRLGIASVL